MSNLIENMKKINIEINEGTKKTRLTVEQKLKKIVDEHQYMKIGGIRIDVQTANLILNILKGVKPEMKKKLLKLPMKKLSVIAWNMVG